MRRAESDRDAGDSPSSSEGSSSSDEDRKIPAAAAEAPSPAGNSKGQQQEQQAKGKDREAAGSVDPASPPKAGPRPTNDAVAAGGNDSSSSSSETRQGSDAGVAVRAPAAEGGSTAGTQLAADGAAKGSGSSASRTTAPSGSKAEAAASAAAVAADVAKRGPRLTQSLEELNASAESVRSQKDLSAEEVQREMGVIYSRRKRVRQKLRVESLELKKHTLTQDNLRLRRENAELEGALRGAVSDVATYERRLDAAQTAAFSSGGNPWAAAAAAAAGRLPYQHPAIPFASSQQQFSALGQHRPFYLPGGTSGYPGMGFYGAPGGGLAHNPILNRILPSMMGGPGDPSAPPSNPSGPLHPSQILSPLRGRSGETAAESHSPPPPSLPPSSLPPSLQGMDPVALQRHFLGQSVVPRMEERLDSIPVQDLQELLHYWSGTSPDAASLLDEYLRRRLHHHHQHHQQSRW